jgi:hypothetical protein
MFDMGDELADVMAFSHLVKNDSSKVERVARYEQSCQIIEFSPTGKNQ